MKKAGTLIVSILIVGGAIGAFVLMRDSDKKKDNSSTQTNTQELTEETSKPEAHDSENVAASNEVTIEDFAFGPESITVKKGTTVTWTNKDSAEHTVTPDDESGAFEGSDLLAQGETYSFTFDEVGTFNYHCQPHPQMTGKVVVTE